MEVAEIRLYFFEKKQFYLLSKQQNVFNKCTEPYPKSNAKR
jgi:hypothetical protein